MAPRPSKQEKGKEMHSPDIPESSYTEPWDKEHFFKKAAQKTFKNKIIHGPFLWEREFPYTPRSDVDVYEALFNVYNGAELSKKRKQAIIQVVQESYANACHSRSRTCIVRGKVIHITVDTFRAVFNLPVVENCKYAYLNDNPKKINRNAVARLLSKPGHARWVMKKGVCKHIRREILNKTAHFWAYFLASNVMPISHLSDIRLERALLIYLLLQREPVDLAVIMVMDEYLQNTIKKHRKGLVFPNFLTDIYKSKGIKATYGDVPLDPMHAFNYNTLKGEDIYEGLNEQNEEEQSADKDRKSEVQPPPTVGDHTIDELYVLLKQIHQNQTWLVDNMTHQGTQIELIHHDQRWMKNSIQQFARVLEVKLPVAVNVMEPEPHDDIVRLPVLQQHFL